MRTTGVYSPKSAGVGAFLAMLLGGVLMVLLIAALNKSVDLKEDSVKKQTRIVKMEKAPKEAVKQEKPKERPQARRVKASSKAQPPDLSNMIGGIEMDIPEFTAAAAALGDSKELLDGIAEDAVMTEETVDSKPQLTHRADIEYPANAAKEGIQGYVVVHLLISKDGNVQLSKVLEAEPQGVFETSVLNGTKDWRFTPARYKGEPVQVWVKQKISFNT
ncbi:MAG: TonB family protein [Desulfosalsimonadaceae bacterium]